MARTGERTGERTDEGVLRGPRGPKNPVDATVHFNTVFLGFVAIPHYYPRCEIESKENFKVNNLFNVKRNGET